MTCGIYKITRKDTGQSYIGLSDNIEKRYRQHANGKDIKYSRIDRAMVKHGEDKFYLEIIEELPNNRVLLMEREKYWITQYNTYEDGSQFNLTPGGDFSPAKLPEVQAKISESLKGIKRSKKTKQKISEAKSSKRHTESTKLKMSRKRNSVGYYRVDKKKDKTCKQGFIWRYEYYDKNHKRVAISSVDINKLEEKVKSKGLPWYKLKD